MFDSGEIELGLGLGLGLWLGLGLGLGLGLVLVLYLQDELQTCLPFELLQGQPPDSRITERYLKNPSQMR